MDAWVCFGGGERFYLMLGYLLGGLANETPKRLYGTSAGALLASLFAFCGIEVCKTIQINQTSQVFQTKDVLADIGDEAFRNRPGLATYKPLLALIQKYIVGKPSVPVTIKRTLFRTGEAQYVTAYPDGTFKTEGCQESAVTTIAGFQDALCSSCINAGSVDAFQDSNNNDWIDGGYNDLGDTSKAIGDGCKDITLLMTGQFTDPALNNQSGDIVGSIIDGYSILIHRVMRADVLLALNHPLITTTIYEATPVGSSSNFNLADNTKNTAIGQAVVPIDGSVLLANYVVS